MRHNLRKWTLAVASAIALGTLGIGTGIASADPNDGGASVGGGAGEQGGGHVGFGSVGGGGNFVATTGVGGPLYFLRYPTLL
jgi:hypothetical protein